MLSHIEYHKKTEVDKQLYNSKISRPSSSPFNSPIVLIPKKLDNSDYRKWWKTIYLRKLNEVTIGDSYPLQNIKDILDQLGNAKYYTTLELGSGYHQIPVKEQDRHKTAFSTGNGLVLLIKHFEFSRMPFGAKGALAVVQRLMNAVLAGLINNVCMVFRWCYCIQ